VSFDLLVWEGPAPADDMAAQVTFARFVAAMESGPFELPSDRIEAFVAALLEHWPDLSGDPDEKSPWADDHLISNARGTCAYLPISSSRADEATVFVARLASAHGLVCFDPQSSTVRSASHNLRRAPRIAASVGSSGEASGSRSHLLDMVASNRG
jgi:hypothetical protein